MFGIIKDVNEKDDPVIFANLMKDQVVIFSNVLRGPDNKPYWLGMGVRPEGRPQPFRDWKEGVKDGRTRSSSGPPHARYTMRLDYLDNIDKEGFEGKGGVKVRASFTADATVTPLFPSKSPPTGRTAYFLSRNLESKPPARPSPPRACAIPAHGKHRVFVLSSRPVHDEQHQVRRERKGNSEDFQQQLLYAQPRGQVMTSKLARRYGCIGPTAEPRRI